MISGSLKTVEKQQVSWFLKLYMRLPLCHASVSVDNDNLFAELSVHIMFVFDLIFA